MTAEAGVRIRLAAAAACLWLAGCAHHPVAPPDAPATRVIQPAALPQVRDQARAEFEDGVRLLRLGPKHQDEARDHLIKATQLDGTLFEAWHDLGYLEASRGNTGKAIAAFQTALDVQPGSRVTALALGESLRRSGAYKKAAKLYGERLSADPKDGELRVRYVQALREAGDLEAALEQTRLLLGQAGDNNLQTVQAYNSLGLIYYKQGKLELAETALRKGADLDPKSAFVWNNLGLVAYARGRDQEAFLDFQKASNLDPKYLQARLNKAAIFMDCGDYKHARAELERAVQSDPGDVDVYVALGVAARGDGQWDDARHAYETALELEPEYAPAFYDLGVLYMDFDRAPDKAQKYFSQYVDLADEDDVHRADAESRLKELTKETKETKSKDAHASEARASEARASEAHASEGLTDKVRAGHARGSER